MPLNHSDLYHVGVVVRDLDAAKGEYGDALGVTWGTEGDFPDATICDDRGSHPAHMRFAYSAEGPVRIELLQAIEDTILVPAGAGDLHHLGYWSSDIDAETERLIGAGMKNLAWFTSSAVDDEAIRALATTELGVVYLQPPSGGIIELVADWNKGFLFPDG